MISDNIVNIGNFAFNNCWSLNSIIVDPFNNFYSSVDGVLFNKSQNTLIQCPGAKTGSYTIPDSVTSIGGLAFDNCSKLTNITIDTNITSIGFAAFQETQGLTNIIIPNSVTTIGNSAFFACHNLTSVTIPNSIISIGPYAFQYCSSLTSIVIPNSVTSIGYSAFDSCYSLTNATIGSGIIDMGGAVFQYCFNLASVYIQGNAPVYSLNYSMFNANHNTVVYYLPGTTGWGSTFAGRPTALWFLPNPQILNSSPNFGVLTNQFGFVISWATNVPVVVEACTNLNSAVWQPIQTNTLVGGSAYFSDPEWTNHLGCFYRLRSP